MASSWVAAMRRGTVNEEQAVSEAGDPAPDQAQWYWLLARDKVSGLDTLVRWAAEA
jgi:hypothetical protein